MTNAEARFNKIHIRKMYACLAVTCHLHFWQNDRDFLPATVVTRGTPSQKQPFSFLGQLAIISARHARQLFSSVPVGV